MFDAGKLNDNTCMIFTLKDITAHFSPDCFNEGWQLFTAGQVTAPNIQRGGELITAIIPVAGSRPLRVYVRTRRERESNGVTIHGECSCANRNNCEHAAAVLLQALEDRQALPVNGDPKPPATGRKTTGRSRSKSTSRPPQFQQELLYILQLDDSAVLIEPLVARKLQQGGHTVIRYYDPARVTGRTPARFLQPVDLELLHALDRSPRTGDTNIPRLDGAQSATLFEGLLATGRCYFENAQRGPPLSQGPARRIGFHWQIDDFGCQRADWRITRAVWRRLLLIRWRKCGKGCISTGPRAPCRNCGAWKSKPRHRSNPRPACA